ncbi:BON domain-containing protein [Ideonella livida]|uniref:BON domain-containing protein n=1 Tax=Ideonella livida TaxID=2707176 RepID=A0A7C9PG30_9BURK|nr:BON domain-containing protein [Ideonella livida]NDY91016.1 BON domain-containing protein [Ideonella livida]
MTVQHQAPRRAGWTSAALLLGAASLLSACVPVPLMIGGLAAGGVLVQTDRRTSGTQLEDQSIEVKAMMRVPKALGDRGHLNFTSYNRVVLITGEAASEADRALAADTASRIENVRSVVNEAAVMTSSALSERTRDGLITTKVKATLVDAGDVEANAFKVVTERGIVYLMGLVTDKEAERATTLIRTIDGVQKVVRVTETISEAQLMEIKARLARPASDKPASTKPAS